MDNIFSYYKEGKIEHLHFWGRMLTDDELVRLTSVTPEELCKVALSIPGLITSCEME